MQCEEIEYASDEEKYFAAWIEEAKERGLIIKEKYQPRPFLLSEKITYQERINKKGNIVEKHLMHPHTYTADWAINWSQKAVDLGIVSIINVMPVNKGVLKGKISNNRILTVIDIKGGFQDNTNDMRFPLNQKWVWQKFGIYVNKVIPFSSKGFKTCFFSETWTPNAYWFRPKKRQKGEFLKVNCIPRTINDFIKLNE